MRARSHVGSLALVCLPVSLRSLSLDAHKRGARLCTGLLVTACAIPQAQEFQQAADHPSRAEVMERCGPPGGLMVGAEGRVSRGWTARRCWMGRA